MVNCVFFLFIYIQLSRYKFLIFFSLLMNSIFLFERLTTLIALSNRVCGNLKNDVLNKTIKTSVKKKIKTQFFTTLNQYLCTQHKIGGCHHEHFINFFFFFVNK